MPVSMPRFHEYVIIVRFHELFFVIWY